MAWALGTQENAWLRQVGGYWNIVASFVLHGVLTKTCFCSPVSVENYSSSTQKSIPWWRNCAQKLNDPEFFLSIEKVVTRTKWGKNRLQFMIKRVAMMRQRALEQKAKS